MAKVIARRRKTVKTLIELSTDAKKADRIINEYYGFRTIPEKIAFLKGMFDFTIVGHENDEPDENTYWIILNAIINEKWN